MTKTVRDWMESAEYDLATAKSLFKARRKIYVIFMCHLAIEKMLKGAFSKKFDKIAPYTHNLIYLLNLLELKPKPEILKFIEMINDKSVPTRYPENVSKMERQFSAKAVKGYLDMAEKTIKWLKQNIPLLK